MKKRFLLLTVVLALMMSAAVMVGCGAKTAEEPAAPATPAPAETTPKPAWADQLITPGGEKVILGSDTNYQPFEFPGDNGGFQGFDVDIMNAIGEKLGVTFEFKTFNFDSLIAGLNGGTEFDMVTSAWTIKPEREKEVNFSTPYFRNDFGVAVATDSTLTSVDDLKKGDTVSVQLGSSADSWAKENLGPKGIKFKKFESTPDCFNALSAGDAVMVIQDLANAAEVVKDPARNAKVVQKIAVDEFFGMGFKKDAKGDAMRADIDKALVDLASDGTYTEIYKKWFGQDPTFLPGGATE